MTYSLVSRGFVGTVTRGVGTVTRGVGAALGVSEALEEARERPAEGIGKDRSKVQ